MTAYTPATFEGINDPRDRQITRLMRTRELESILANCTWAPQAHRDAANAKIEILTAQIDALNAAKRGM